MNQNRDRQTGSTEQDDKLSRGAIALVLQLMAFLVAPLVVGWWLAPLLAEHPRAWERRRRVPVLAGIGLLLALITWHEARPILAELLPIGWGSVIPLAVLWIVLTPWAVVVALLRLPGCATALEEGRANPVQADRWRRAIWTASARDAAKAATRAKHDPTVVGIVVQDDRRDMFSRLRDRRNAGRNKARWTDGQSLLLPADPPRVALFGASGFGKSWTLHRLVKAALLRGWRVAYFDGKGRSKDAEELRDLAAEHPTVWWRSHSHQSGCPFDAWRGGAPEVVNKALTLMGQARISPQASDAAKHYRRQTLGVLAAVVGPAPWPSASDLLERLRNPAPWVSSSARLSELKAKDRGGRPEHLRVAAELATNLDVVGNTLDGRTSPLGWCWEEGVGAPWRLAIITINGAEGPAATLPGAVILTDLAAYLNDESRRSPDAAPLLVIMDEAQTLLDDPNAPEIAQVFEQMRSANAGIIVACQSVQGLGEQGERILRAGADFIVGNMAEAEDLVGLAGTVRAVEVAHQGDDEGRTLTGRTAAREQAQQRLDPDRLREARTGLFAVIERGQPVRWASMCPSLVGDRRETQDAARQDAEEQSSQRPEL